MSKDSDNQPIEFDQSISERGKADLQPVEPTGAHWLQTLASVSPVGILRADTRRLCIYVNQNWCEMSGLTPEQSMGSGWLRAFHPDDRHRVFKDWEKEDRETRQYR